MSCRLLWASALPLLSSCLTGDTKYTEPPPLSFPVPNTRVVEKSKEEVWKHLVQRLGKEFFVVNNIDKDSGFVNVSYSGDPEKYCDCGTAERWVSNAAGKRTYAYPCARGSVQYEEVAGGNLYVMTRQMQPCRPPDDWPFTFTPFTRPLGPSMMMPMFAELVPLEPRQLPS